MKKIVVVYVDGMFGHNNRYAAVFDDSEIRHQDLRELLELTSHDDFDVLEYQELELVKEMVEKKSVQFKSLD